MPHNVFHSDEKLVVQSRSRDLQCLTRVERCQMYLSLLKKTVEKPCPRTILRSSLTFVCLLNIQRLLRSLPVHFIIVRWLVVSRNAFAQHQKCVDFAHWWRGVVFRCGCANLRRVRAVRIEPRGGVVRGRESGAVRSRNGKSACCFSGGRRR